MAIADAAAAAIIICWCVRFRELGVVAALLGVIAVVVVVFDCGAGWWFWLWFWLLSCRGVVVAVLPIPV